MPITFVQFLQLFDPCLIFFSRRLILFHQTHEHTEHQSSENLHFGFCCHAFPSITYTESLWTLPKICPQSASWQGIYCIRLHCVLSLPRSISRFNVIGLQGSVIKCSLENFEEINSIICVNLYFYFIFQSVCKSKLLCGRETYITHFNI